MLGHVRSFVVAAVVMLVLDSIWLVAVASPLYDAELGDRIAASPDLVAGGLFYVVYLVALVWFAVRPAVVARSLRSAAGNGALLGVAAYATWALTNKAVLADWPWALVPLDIAWGGVLSAVAALAATAVALRRTDASRLPAGGEARAAPDVYRWCMSRTNIELDDDLVAEVMRRHGVSTKRAAVDLALRRLVGPAMTREEMLALRGTGWDADLDAVRGDAPESW